jgi:hypothetical protein
MKALLDGELSPTKWANNNKRKGGPPPPPSSSSRSGLQSISPIPVSRDDDRGVSGSHTDANRVRTFTETSLDPVEHAPHHAANTGSTNRTTPTRPISSSRRPYSANKASPRAVRPSSGLSLSKRHYHTTSPTLGGSPTTGATARAGGAETNLIDIILKGDQTDAMSETVKQIDAILATSKRFRCGYQFVCLPCFTQMSC